MSAQCSGISARWCDVCGDCVCYPYPPGYFKIVSGKPVNMYKDVTPGDPRLPPGTRIGHSGLAKDGTECPLHGPHSVHGD